MKRSREKPRPHENVAYRRNYMARNSLCELYPILLTNLDDSVEYLSLNGVKIARDGVVLSGKVIAIDEIQYPFIASSDPHHLNVGKPRWDIPSNLIALSRKIHELVEKLPLEGMVWCWFAKMVKREYGGKKYAEEFDLPSICHVHQKNFVGMLEGMDTSRWNPGSRSMHGSLLEYAEAHPFEWTGDTIPGQFRNFTPNR